ncbi:outer membrane lipoprotein-sorting protein [Algoriphagus iocasae]|jgi:outer membrane lipoprotein-sorting protein|uniref:Outer membrane lipoprotein-sorting protein n=1 Tax=Algoriphagus iocasae TaxID=1836499 RepID=A0A841MJL3_9BACT|nr:outer membrane lipoprotein carrier protein LolA [Algoriphagus iocasae]MBB6327073.1 outer membrane lipoprotein-sorting protein [Algoriphagus iocasae]
MKKLALVFTLFLVAIFNFDATAQKDPKAKAVLDGMSQKYQSMKGFTASFDYTYSDQAGTSDRQSGDISVKGNQYRLKLPDQEIFNDGKTVWTFIETPSYKEVTINDVSQMEGELTPTNIYKMYESGFNYKLLADKTFQGKQANVVELDAEKSNAPFQKVKLMIDKNTKDLLGWEMFDGQGGSFSYAFKNLKPDPSIPDSHFVFDTKKHAGVEVIDLR